MRFLIDADLPYSLADVLSRYGHEAIRVRDTLGSATDEEIFDYANRNECIVVTRDLGFAEDFMKKRGLVYCWSGYPIISQPAELKKFSKIF